MQANYGENEMKSLLQKVRIFNKDIGSYQMFVITDNFDYAVKLSNGRILFRLEELQDDERDALTAERLQAIANRFTSSMQTTTQQQTVSPQPQPQTTLQTQTPKKKRSVGKTILIIVIVLIILIGGLVFLNEINRGGNGYGSGSYQEKVMTVEEIERSQPTNFLTASGYYNENFWGDKLKVHGTITNSATVASYKDAVVRITYYSKTKTELGSKDYTIYEVFPPHSTKNFELKIDNYKDVNSIGWDVVSAVAN